MRILIADDSFDWLKIHAVTINGINSDIEIVSANSAFEAFEIYKQNFQDEPFDYVITDLQMEDNYEQLLAGEWLVQEIQSLKYEQKIMIVSSQFNIEQIADSYNVDYYSKRSIIANITDYEKKLSKILK